MGTMHRPRRRRGFLSSLRERNRVRANDPPAVDDIAAGWCVWGVPAYGGVRCRAPGSTGCMRASRPDSIILDMDSSETRLTASRGFCLERSLRLHLLSPADRVQPLRRPGALPVAARQCPQRRGLALSAGAGGRPLPRARRRSLSPRRCRVRQARLLEAEVIRYATRLPANQVLQRRIGHC
jgi:hypothetical protein